MSNATDYSATILKDSISPVGIRLITFEVTFPRIILAEFNTHRVLGRSSASSRAIPVAKRIKSIEEAPFIPAAFGANQKGMQAADADSVDQDRARAVWLSARDSMAGHAATLAEIGVHKQWANRLLEPFCWHTVITTATEWTNFFRLRIHKNAQPEIRTAAELMRDAMAASVPTPLKPYQWHLPLVDERDALLNLREKVQCCVARCARTSYLTHDGVREPSADLGLHDRLLTDGHMSPLENAATPALAPFAFHGHLRGWTCYRKMIPGEAIFEEGRALPKFSDDMRLVAQ